MWLITFDVKILIEHHPSFRRRYLKVLLRSFILYTGSLSDVFPLHLSVTYIFEYIFVVVFCNVGNISKFYTQVYRKYFS